MSRSSLLAACWYSLAKVPTAIHLFCAERELRIAERDALPETLWQARKRNLDALRAYRSRGEFPHNDHHAARLIPCFIDPRGRQCAVAYLMCRSGAKDAASTIARHANYSRIREMQFPEFADWAKASGLTTKELARIQPGYVPTPEQLAKYHDLARAVWILGVLGVFSIIANCSRLVWAYVSRLSGVFAGILVGFALLYFSLFADLSPFTHTHELRDNASTYQSIACLLGATSLVCAAVRFLIPRTKPEQARDRRTAVKVLERRQNRLTSGTCEHVMTRERPSQNKCITDVYRPRKVS